MNQTQNSEEIIEDDTTPVACTMEAKICPDGTSVGRTGPNCEFSPCPEVEEVEEPADFEQKVEERDRIPNDQGMEYPIPDSEQGMFCTSDVQKCEDGSFVGRIPPSCNFAACPTAIPGEDTAANQLLDREWEWQKTIYNNDTEVVPVHRGEFTLTFQADNSFSADTDCNTFGGTYSTDANTLSFGAMMSTRMYCTDSQEDLFSGMLSEVQSFLYTEDGALVLELPYDTGSMIFE
ncbi:META domain-containing protein [bacterium]|nr:META domain-containing protein [bacterium]